MYNEEQVKKKVKQTNKKNYNSTIVGLDKFKLKVMCV